MTHFLSLWRGLIPIQSQRPRMVDICDVVALEYQVLPEEIKGRRRFQEIVWPRHAFMYRARQAGFSLTRIGQFCGDRDHSSVSEGCRRHALRTGEPMLGHVVAGARAGAGE